MERRTIIISAALFIIGILIGALGVYLLAPITQGPLVEAVKPVIYIQIRDPGDFNHLVLMEGAKRFAEMKGLIFESFVHHGDVDAAMKALDEIVTKYGPNRVGFVSVPHDMGHFKAIADYCEEKGVYWAAWYGLYEGFPLDDYPHLVWSGQSPAYEEGYATAKALVEAMGGKGNIVFLGGGVGVPCWQFRVLGMLDYIETVPEVNILDGGFVGLTQEEAMSVMETYIAKYGDQIDGVWGVFIAPSIGALKACEKHGLAVPISTIDVTPEILDYIINGKEGEPRICATWDNNSYWCGMSAAAAVYKAIVEGWSPPYELKAFHWKGYIVDKSNAEIVKQTKYSYPWPDYATDKYIFGPDNCFVERNRYNLELLPTPEQMEKLEPWMK